MRRGSFLPFRYGSVVWGHPDRACITIGAITSPHAALLSRAESDAIDALIENIESRTGVQMVVAAIGKSDSYAELPWKAFALGASVAALATVLGDLWWPQWVSSGSALIVASALLGVFVPPFARLFLRAARGHAEVRQYAQALFLARELLRTHDRTAVLIL